MNIFGFAAIDRWRPRENEDDPRYVRAVPEWPLIGRDAEVASVVETLAAERGVVLVGEAGVGKSRLARGVLAAASAGGWVTWWFDAGSSASSVPFAPFASLLDDLADRDPVERLLHARRRLLGSGDRVVLVVDDAHLLDDVSVAFVRGLLADSDVRVVLTVRTGTTTVPLWTGALRRQEVVRLSRPEVEELVRAGVGADVDPTVLRWAWTITEGNALFVRELISDALERGVLVERAGRFVLEGDAAHPGARVQEVIAARIGALDDDERAAVELVALSEPVGLGLVESLVSPEALRSIERRGLLRAERRDRRTEVRLAHPLHAEVSRSLLGPSTAAAHHRRLLDAVGARGARRADDRVQVALWRLEIGDVDSQLFVDVATTLSRASEALHGARPPRRTPVGGSDSRDLAIRLARAALVGTGSVDAAAMLAWMLYRLGRSDEAEAVTASMDQLVHDDRELVAVARTQAAIEVLFTNDPSSALRRLEAAEAAVADVVLKLEARAARATLLVVIGRTPDAYELSASVFGDARADHESRLRAMATAAVALGYMGRTTESLALLDEAQALVTDRSDVRAVGLLTMSRILVLFAEGRFVEMEQLCSFSLSISEQMDSDEGVAVFSAIGAVAATGSGRLLTALRLADVALRRTVEVDSFGIRALAWAARTKALGYLARAEEAAAALADLELEPCQRQYSAEVLRARAWSQVAGGRATAARRTLEEAVERAADMGHAASQLMGLHDLVRLGTPGLLPRVERLVPLVDGPYAQLVLGQVAGLAAADAAVLEEAARGHDALGSHLLAAECWGQAAGVHRRAGRRGDANDAAGSCKASLAHCEGPPRTPALAEAEPLGALTRREREIVGLASEGLSDKEIAAHLVVSARTVQAHLHNAYAKLGVEGRGGLSGP